MNFRWSLVIVASVGFWGATTNAHGQHAAAAAGGAGGLAGFSGLSAAGTSGAVSGNIGFGGAYAVSGGFGGYGMGSYGINGWGQGSPYGGWNTTGFGGSYYSPMMMNQAMYGNYVNGLSPTGLGPNMSTNLNGNTTNAGVGISGSARSDPSISATLNGATARPGTSAKSKATRSRTKTARKR